MGIRMRTALGAALVVLVVAAGCSDGDDDDAATNDDKGAADDSARDNGDDNGSGDAGDIEAPEGSDPELRQEYIDAIVAATPPDPSVGFDAAAVECLATAFVDAAGTDALSDAVTPEELQENPDVGPTELGVEFPDNADDVFYDELSTCVDIRALILTNLSGGDEAVSECLEDAVDDDLVKDYTVAVFISGLAEGDPERTALEQRISDVVDPCMPS
jgi:hypothetical protein